jgi:hypothetical protein
VALQLLTSHWLSGGVVIEQDPSRTTPYWPFLDFSFQTVSLESSLQCLILRLLLLWFTLM